MNYKFLFVFIFKVVYIYCQNQNLFKNIIDNYKSNSNYETSYIINDEIQKIFNTKAESFSIPIYISVLDLTHINILNITNDRKIYLDNYNNLLGVSNRVIINKKKKDNKNKIMQVFLNGTISIKNNSNLDEMIIKKILFEKTDYKIDLYFLKNRYMSQYQNINKDNQNLFKFYDLNVLFYKDSNNLYKEIEKNEFVFLKKIENNLTENETEQLIYKFIEDFINDSEPIKLKKKINDWIKIKNIINDLLAMKHCNVNLHNFLLINEINHIKEKIEIIEQNLLPILFSDQNKEKNFIEFNNSINNLKEYLKKYDVYQNDYKIDIYFTFLTLGAIIIVIFLCYKIYNEFRNAFFRKIK